MRTKFSLNSDRSWKPALCVLGLAALFFILRPEAPAQYGSEEALQTFDYNPKASETPKIQEESVSVSYSDAELVNDPVQGVFIVSKDRWKNWISRAIYILILDLALMVILLSLPRTAEYNIIIGYVLSGASAVLSFWVFLCAWLLFMLHTWAWMAILPLSIAMGIGTHIMLMKIKNSDISLSELKESFQKMSALAKEDLRLTSIEGSPGNWAEQDFLK